MTPSPSVNKAYGLNQDQEPSLKERLVKSTMTGLGTMGLAAGSAAGGMHLDQTLSPEEASHLVNSISQRERIPVPKRMTTGDGFLANARSAYAPDLHLVMHANSPKQGILAHEMGHASMQGPGAIRGLRRKALQSGLLQKAHRGGASAAGLMLLSPDEKIRNAAVPTSLALSAPLLAEEAVASAKALRNIHKLKGAGAALRAAPGLAGAFSTYAAAPAGIWLANKWLKKSKKKMPAQNGGIAKAASLEFWQGFEKRAFDAEYGHPDDQLAADRAVKRNAKNRRNLGGALGLLGGTAGSLLRERSLKSGLIGAGAGTVIGGAAGHLAAKLEEKKIREKLKNESPYGTVANRSIWPGQEAHSPLQRALKDPDAEVSFFDEKGNQYDSTRHPREKMHGRLEEMKKSNPGRFGYMVGLPKSKYQVDDIRNRIESYGE